MTGDRGLERAEDVEGAEVDGFGRTWWGRAWVQALEQRARLDPNRLPRGRGYARDGAVGELLLGRWSSS